ncbi:MAG TPA: hypothetical protein PK661_09610 [Syntrophorhabdaceae bacterium]|jgi:hypothetical protein|nr:hypothetical protein [Pseudomonadota bacterium]HOS60340.1 hypothetical protein [Syntrophorhabdaceae bacterium]HQP51967.1 hypothetical protein [Syntrophorhabdaceae bacterium]
MPYITDLGIDVTKYDGKINILRYGVWDYDSDKGRDKVLECSNNLEYLKTKYNTNKIIRIR